MLKKLFKILFSLSLFLAPGLALAHETGLEHFEPALDQQISSLVVTVVTVVSIWVGLLVLITLTRRTLEETHKQELFWGITAPVILATLFIAGSTVYLNIISTTKGPVHWHADFRIYNCGKELDLQNPEGLSNRIGTPTLHEHDDSRIHIEGTVHRLSDVSLGAFFETIGGEVSHGELVLPTNEGMVRMTNGMLCESGEYAGRPASWQVFLYRTEGDKVYQEKLPDWPNHVPSPYTKVPPGDCIIMEFTPEFKSQTDKICDFYAIELNQGNLQAANFEYGN